MYRNFKAGKIQYTALLPIFGSQMKVQVVNDSTRSASFGFVQMDDSSRLPTHFWYFQAGQFEIKRYNDNILFVVIKDRFKNKLEKIKNL